MMRVASERQARRSAKWLLLAVVGTLAGAGAGALVARHRRADVPTITPATNGATLGVPRAATSIAIDGELEDPAWVDASRTGALELAGRPARPFSEARFTWRDDTLFVELYAADEDLRGGVPRDPEHDTVDAYRVTLRGPNGVHEVLASPDHMTTSLPSVRAAFDRDGTLDDDRDDDEEWVVELAIPLPAIGLRGERGERFELAVERCDTVRSRPHRAGDPGQRQCASWGTDRARTLRLD